jgi:hypothetical protein
MIWSRGMLLALWLAWTALGDIPPCAAADVPERSASGQTLRVPEKHRTVGEVYYVLPAVGTQLTWETNAPLLRLVATCNRVVGYVAAPFELEEGRPPFFGGALRVPVASLSTGYEQFDASLHSPDVLGRDEYPEILVSLAAVSSSRNVAKTDNREQCEFDLAGELTVRGKAVPFKAPARMALLPFSSATGQFSPSDLLMLRTRLSFALSDVGITDASVFGPGSSASRVDVGLYLMCTTVHPEKNFDPRNDDELFVKQLEFMTRLRDFNDPVNAYAAGRELMKKMWDDSRMLNNLAMSVLAEEHVQRRDLMFIERAAQRANELTKHKDPQCLNTLALLCYERGDLDGAVKWCRQAVDNLAGQPFFVGPPIRAALQSYEAQAQARHKDTATPPENTVRDDREGL